MMLVFCVPKEFKRDGVSFAFYEDLQRRSSIRMDCGSSMHKYIVFC